MSQGSSSNAMSASADAVDSVVIFSARETPEVLARTISSVLVNAVPNIRLDVLVNGNTALSSAMSSRLKQLLTETPSAAVRVWEIAAADKANAWNQHIHHIWPGRGNAFYIDGYVRLLPDSLKLLRNRLAVSPDALAATGLPSVGRSATRQRQLMLAEGGLHGNFCAIKEEALLTMRERGIRLPVGIYRTDSTIGAYLSFGLDPAVHLWNAHKFIAIEPGATWVTDKKHWWRMADLKAMLNRKKRQAQGEFENRAVRYHLAKLRMRPENLPGTVNELVANWLAVCSSEAQEVEKRSYFAKKALAALHARQLANPTDGAPNLVFDSHPWVA